MQWQGIREHKARCQEKIIDNNPSYQHLTQQTLEIASLISKAIQPGILSNILLYLGNIGPISKKAEQHINKKKILSEWLEQINIQTSFEDIKETEIPLLWKLYQTRINNAPNKTILRKAIGKDLRTSIFYAKLFIYNGAIEELPEYFGDISDSDIDFITEYLSDFIESKKMRTGDAIFLRQYETEEYPNYGTLIYDGTKLLDLNYNLSDSGILPNDIHINNFPIVDYFSGVLVNKYNLVNFDTQYLELELIKTYVGYGKIPIYQYEGDDYIIWSTRDDLDVECEDTLLLTNDFTEFTIYTGHIFTKEFKELYIDSSKSLKVLFDIYYTEESEN